VAQNKKLLKIGMEKDNGIKEITEGYDMMEEMMQKMHSTMGRYETEL
jgi:hypothetical protein